jgi:hypothetical protein
MTKNNEDDFLNEDQEEFEIDISENDSATGDEATDEKEDFEGSEEKEQETPEKHKADPSLEEETARQHAKADGYDYDDLTDEEKAKYGRRAQKRIKTLVGKTKTLEEQLLAKEKRAKELEDELNKYRGLTEETTLYAFEQQEKRIEAQRAEASRKMIEAREAGDYEAETKAFDTLSALRSEENELKRAKLRFVPKKKKQESDEDNEELGRRPKREEQTVVETTNTATEPDPRALDWYEKNLWFGDQNDPSHRMMTARAIQIHQALIDEGLDPTKPDDAEEYYEELDSRLRARYKDYFKDAATKREKPKQTMTGGNRSAGVKKNTVTLTKSQVETARRLGITPQQYAKELAKLNRGERAS